MLAEVINDNPELVRLERTKIEHVEYFGPRNASSIFSNK